jgi:uncharacterized membrane protein YeaQ/YmgE (transglycosylase-associated protein family)
MDPVTIIIALVAGAVGGWLIGMVAKNMSGGMVVDLIAGLIGGIILVWIGVAANFASWGGVQYLGVIVLGLIGGIVLAAIVGTIRKNMMKTTT